MNQYVRAYEPSDDWPKFNRHEQRLPRIVLVFDTETTTDTQQTFRVGAYQLRVSGKLVESGIFYPDNLDDFRRRLVNVSRAKDAAIVGFNLPFDISRIACTYGEARGSMKGGFSFGIQSNSGVRLRTKHLGGRKTMFRWGGDPSPKGSVIDVAMLAKALLGRHHSLDSLGKALRIASRKTSATHGGAIDRAYLDYLQRDVQATWECYQKLTSLWTDYGLGHTHVSRVYSEASIGKAALREMNVRPFSCIEHNATQENFAAAFESFYGGRSEVNIRREPTEVVYVDFLSMYPTVNALMHLWDYVTAQRLEVRHCGREATKILRETDLPRLLNQEAWAALPMLVRIQPSGDLLPVRANYSQSASIGLNYITSTEPLWYTLADALASKVLTGGKLPCIVDAISIRPKGKQRDLGSWDVLGLPEYRLDPAAGDLYRRMVELRATTTGDERDCLKRIINSVCYGIFAELNEQPNDVKQREYVTGSGSRPSQTRRQAETPGLYHNPFLATFITGAARLMLATLEAQLRGGNLAHVLCDTDSFAIGVASASDRRHVDSCVRSYRTLNPYREPIRNILKVEHGDDERRPVYAYAISAKRYALYRLTGCKSSGGNSGCVEIVKASAHGLGHLRPPTGSNIRKAEAPEWLIPVWREIIAADGHRKQRPRFRSKALDAPAMSQFTVTSPALLRYEMPPYSFASVFRIAASCPLPHAGVAVAPFERRAWEAAKGATIFSNGEREQVQASDLLTYREALNEYWTHPEAKFANGEDRGRMRRRHVYPERIVYIGKEGGDLEGKVRGIVSDNVAYGSRNLVERVR